MKWWEKALKIAPSRKGRSNPQSLARIRPRERKQPIDRPCGTGRFWKNATHHFVVGYYQMSLRDEVLSECYLALS
ncbi:MAG: hypothetical protein QOH31_3694 [Verrucomicrobiota bacterium]